MTHCGDGSFKTKQAYICRNQLFIPAGWVELNFKLALKVNSFGKRTDIGDIFVWRYDKETLFGQFWNDNINILSFFWAGN